MKERRKIGVDVDDVLAHCVKRLLSYHNETYTTFIEYHHVIAFALWKVWGGTMEETNKKLEDFYLSKHFKNMDPVEDAIDSIKYLAKKNDLIAITARPESTRLETESWLQNNFLNCFSDLFLVGGKNLKKSQICMENKIKIMIDDSLHNAKDCAENGIRTILIDRPWNQEPISANIERVFSWKEIIQRIK